LGDQAFFHFGSQSILEGHVDLRRRIAPALPFSMKDKFSVYKERGNDFLNHGPIIKGTGCCGRDTRHKFSFIYTLP
jgi:hypothetical protein